MRINQRIKTKKIRLVSEDGEQLGIIDTEQGLEKAREKNLDLVEVAPQAKPPVCKIMDYNKYKYEQQKKRKKAQKTQKAQQLKQIRVRPKIEEHDYQVKLRHLREFLEKGHKVRISLMFKGRENAHPELGRELLDKFIQDLSDIGELIQPPKLSRNIMATLLDPKK